MSRCLLIALSLALLLAACGEDKQPEAPTTAAKIAPTPTVATCDEVAYTPKANETWSHPSQNFYAPDAADAPTHDDLQHLLTSDNAVVVTYTTQMDQPGQDRLAAWAGKQTATVVVPDTAEGAPQVTATIATAKLTCDALDEAQLTTFAAKRGTASVEPHGEG